MTASEKNERVLMFYIVIKVGNPNCSQIKLDFE